ncbi:MAG: hypothetical protein ACREQQ_09375 [Candidatus Binatia bacterium]
MFLTWAEFYQSDLQSVYALWIAPVLFLAWALTRRDRTDLGRGVEPRARSFIDGYAIVFSIETMLDPLVSGPVLRWLRVEDPVATYGMVPFVLLGDFRVYLLLFFMIAPDRGIGAAAQRAAAWTPIVPIFAWTTTSLLRSAFGPMPSQTIWIAYELGFLAIASYLALRLLPASLDAGRRSVGRYLRALTLYVAAYYALWVTADLLIVLAGIDAAWALRAVANQLYYSFWVPFAYFSFFSPRFDDRARN